LVNIISGGSFFLDGVHLINDKQKIEPPKPRTNHDTHAPHEFVLKHVVHKARSARAT